MSSDVAQILNSAVIILALVAALAAAFSRFKKWVQAQVVVPAKTAVTVAEGVSEQVTRVESQVHSNHGTSMADDVSRVGRKVDGIAAKIDTLDTRFDDHLRLGHPPAEGS